MATVASGSCDGQKCWPTMTGTVNDGGRGVHCGAPGKYASQHKCKTGAPDSSADKCTANLPGYAGAAVPKGLCSSIQNSLPMAGMTDAQFIGAIKKQYGVENMNLADARCGCSAEVKALWTANQFAGFYDCSLAFVSACSAAGVGTVTPIQSGRMCDTGDYDYGGSVAATTTAAAANVTATTAAPPATVAVKMTVQGVDFAKLSASATMLASFKTGVKATVAAEASTAAGATIPATAVAVTVSSGSVVVDAVITPPSGVDSSKMGAALTASTTMSTAVVAAVKAVPGIAAATSGDIGVTTTVAVAGATTVAPRAGVASGSFLQSPLVAFLMLPCQLMWN